MPHHTIIPDLSMKIIDKGRLQLLEILGVGGFGTVYRAHDRECYGSPTFRAVKVMPRIDDIRSERGKLIEREYIHHQFVSGHPNIVKLHRMTYDSDYVYLVLDYVPGGDLLSHIFKHRLARNDELIKSLLIQLVDGVYACHQNRIYHRDLKPENVLVSSDLSSAFLGDFGLSSMSPGGRSNMFRVGTANYMSPECYNIRTWDDYDLRRNDIWAIGMIAICMICGRCPWTRASLKDGNFAAYVSNTGYLRTVLPISEEADDIIRSIFILRESRCIDLLTLRQRLVNVKTFYMSDEELGAASSSARSIYEDYQPRMQGMGDTTLAEELSSSDYLSASGEETSRSTYSDELEANVVVRPVVDTDGPFSSFVNESEMPALGDVSEMPALVDIPSPVPPPFDVPAVPEHAFSLGTSGSSSSSSSSENTEFSSAEESDAPITPETHAQDPEVVIPEMSGEVGLGEQAVKFELQPFEKTRRSLTGPQFRVLSGMLDNVGRMLTAA